MRFSALLVLVVAAVLMVGGPMGCKSQDHSGMKMMTRI